MNKQFLCLPAPAKLNLFLHVVGRRPDGKHLLQSVFVPIDLCDSIDLVERSDGHIVRTGDLTGPVEKDLAVRAAELLKAHCGVKAGVEIGLTKRIPVGAGMGGGSSDAATVLIGLNRLWGTGLSRTELMGLGERLGADVPFFIFGEPAFVEGIGERMTALCVPPTAYLVCWPGKGVSTSEIFGSADLTRDTLSRTIAFFSDSLRDNWPALPGRNDLEPVACRIEPRVRQALDLLSARGCAARMTGSGSAVFAVESAAAAHSADKPAALPEDWQWFRVEGLARHPLAAWLDED